MTALSVGAPPITGTRVTRSSGLHSDLIRRRVTILVGIAFIVVGGSVWPPLVIGTMVGLLLAAHAADPWLTVRDAISMTLGISPLMLPIWTLIGLFWAASANETWRHIDASRARRAALP